MSSSAQLSLLPWLLRWEPVPDGTTFASGLHAGSSLGVVLAFRQDLVALDRAALRRLLLTSAPAAVAGLVGQRAVEERFGRPGPTAGLLAAAGALMWLADRRPQTTAVGPVEAGLAGAAQVLALAPGVSRSGAAFTALRWRGVPREDALRYSMLMSLPVTAGAGLLTALRSRQTPAPVPAVLAAGSALVAARTVRGASYRVVTGAALYRLGVAAAVLVRLRANKGSA